METDTRYITLEKSLRDGGWGKGVEGGGVEGWGLREGGWGASKGQQYGGIRGSMSNFSLTYVIREVSGVNQENCKSLSRTIRVRFEPEKPELCSRESQLPALTFYLKSSHLWTAFLGKILFWHCSDVLIHRRKSPFREWHFRLKRPNLLPYWRFLLVISYKWNSFPKRFIYWIPRFEVLSWTKRHGKSFLLKVQ